MFLSVACDKMYPKRKKEREREREREKKMGHLGKIP